MTSTIILMLSMGSLYPLMSSTQATAEQTNTWRNWTVTDEAVEAGGYVDVRGFPSVVRPERTYPVNFTFHVVSFSWGSSIRPRSVEWLAHVCLERSPVSCVRYGQNLTLGHTILEGNYSLGERFNASIMWRLTSRPLSNNTEAILGMRMQAALECWDTSRCLSKGESKDMSRSYLQPEILLTLIIPGTVGGILNMTNIGIWTGLSVGALVALAVLIIRSRKMRRSEHDSRT